MRLDLEPDRCVDCRAVLPIAPEQGVSGAAQPATFIGLGARTAIASSVGRLSMPVSNSPSPEFGRGWATLTVTTFAMPWSVLIR